MKRTHRERPYSYPCPDLTLNNSKLRQLILLLIDALHRQTRDGATVSFDHNLALKIEKLIIGNIGRAKIIAPVRTGIHKPRTLGAKGQRRMDLVPSLIALKRSCHVHLPTKASRHPERPDFHENKHGTTGAVRQSLERVYGNKSELLASRGSSHCIVGGLPVPK